jgi:putative transposase
LDRAFQNFFRRVKAGGKPGHPRFRSRDRYDSFTFPQAPSGAKLLPSGRLRLFGVGELKVKLHRPLEGTVKTVTLKRAGGKWSAIFCCDLGDAKAEPNGLPAVGIDVGLLHFLTTSDGETVANPRFLRKQLPALRRLERVKARKRRGGSNRKKAAAAVGRLHAKVANCRKDFHFKIAHNLTSRFGAIAAEGLSVQGMVKNRRLARSISDAGWAGFLGKLAGKAESAGSRVVVVSAAYTSQDCSACGRREAKALSARVHRCGCGLVLDRDWNAAKNVLARAGLAGARPVGAKGDGAFSQEAASL